MSNFSCRAGVGGRGHRSVHRVVVDVAPPNVRPCEQDLRRGSAGPESGARTSSGPMRRWPVEFDNGCMEAVRQDRIDRALTWSVRTMAIASVVAAAGVVVDDRELLGVPVWWKPLKFSLSIAISVIGLQWLRRRLPRDRWVDAAALIAAISLIVEQVLIAMQAARGVRSHFNTATPFDAQVFGLMGTFVGIVFVAGLIVAWRSFVHRALAPVTRAVVTAGSNVTVLGMLVGFAMTMPLPNQNLPTGIVGAHSVGGPDGGPGLPLLGWSTEHGDLRVAHFVGLHAFHLLIVLAAWLRRQDRPVERTRTTVIATATSLGVATVLLAVQALAGYSVASPSTVLVAAISIAAATAVGRAAASVRQSSPTSNPTPVGAPR